MSAERFAQGMTFDEYVKFVSTPENLKREGSFNMPRRDYGDFLRKAFEAAQLTDAQREAWQWIVSQPNGPAKMLVISEEWSSDCRRDVPVLARLAAAGGLEMRIFPRDGHKISSLPVPDPKESPNADLMAQFLKKRGAETFQSIPIAAFYTKGFEPLYTYTEFPQIYRKDRVVGAIRAPKPGESKDDTLKRGLGDFFAFQQTPFFRLYAAAAVDEIIAMLHERLRVGSLA
ncbi:MAG TPA: thioredoxin family protein [Methylomirabilota bacterium]|nr:thioredoxin family protein [Methylomirabilota bacterium]